MHRFNAIPIYIPIWLLVDRNKKIYKPFMDAQKIKYSHCSPKQKELVSWGITVLNLKIHSRDIVIKQHASNINPGIIKLNVIEYHDKNIYIYLSMEK